MDENLREGGPVEGRPETGADLLRRLAADPARTPRERIILRAAAARMEDSLIGDGRRMRAADYYRLEPVWIWRPEDGGDPPIETSALVACALTGRTLAGSGGPAHAVVPDVVHAPLSVRLAAGRVLLGSSKDER